MAIVGGSGSGKTTLLRLANRLIEADSGAITVEGDDVSTVDPILLRRRIGYVFQSGGLFPHLTVADNIGITPKLTGTAPAEISARVDDCSTWCGSTARNIATACRTNFPAASASASAWRARSPQSRASC